METSTNDVEMEDMDSAGPSTEQESCQRLRRQKSPKQVKKRTEVKEIRRVETQVTIKPGQALPKCYGPRDTILHDSKRIPVLVANVPAVISVVFPKCFGKAPVCRPDISERKKTIQELTDLMTSYNIMSLKNRIQHKFENNPWIFEEFMNYTEKSKEKSERLSSNAIKMNMRKNRDRSNKIPGHGKKQYRLQPTKSNFKTNICHLCLHKRKHKIRRQREKHWKRLEMRYDELWKLHNELNKLSLEEKKRFDQKQIYFQKDVVAFKDQWSAKLATLVFIKSHRIGKHVTGTWIIQRKRKKYREDNEISYKCHNKCILREELQSSRKKAREIIQNNNRPTLLTMTETEMQRIIEDEESKKEIRDENMIEHLMSLLSL